MLKFYIALICVVASSTQSLNISGIKIWVKDKFFADRSHQELKIQKVKKSVSQENDSFVEQVEEEITLVAEQRIEHGNDHLKKFERTLICMINNPTILASNLTVSACLPLHTTMP